MNGDLIDKFLLSAEVLGETLSKTPGSVNPLDPGYNLLTQASAYLLGKKATYMAPFNERYSHIAGTLLFHPGAPHGALLLGLRSAQMEDKPSTWGLPCGNARGFQTFAEIAAWQTRAEIGLELTPERLGKPVVEITAKNNYGNEYDRKLVQQGFFVALRLDEATAIQPKDETSKVVWATREEVNTTYKLGFPELDLQMTNAGFAAWDIYQERLRWIESLPADKRDTARKLLAA